MAGPELGQPVEPGLLVAAFRRRLGDDVHGGAEVAQAAPEAGVDGGVADQDQRVAPQPAFHGQRQPEGARRRLDDDGAGVEQAVLPGLVEDVPGRQQLHEAEGGAEEVGSEVDDPGQFQSPGDGSGDRRSSGGPLRQRH